MSKPPFALPLRAASMAGLASVSASTYHWSVNHGSITWPERSPKGVWMTRSSTFSSRPKASSAATTILRALVGSPSMPKRYCPIYSAGMRPSAVCTTRPSPSSMLNMSLALNPARLPTSKSLKSCPGVIFTAPEPNSGSACSSVTIGINRPVIGKRTFLPTRCA